jgi:uncharacterized MAPEG superfamily protein
LRSPSCSASVLSAQTKALQLGYRWAGGPRDEPRLPLTNLAGRLERALANFLETFPLFAAAVLVAHAAGWHDWMTVWGELYLVARVVYVPLYAFGVPIVRSLAWNVATIGIILIFAVAGVLKPSCHRRA